MISRRMLTLLSLALLLAACAAPEKPRRVLWPAPPERARFEWLKNFYSQDDFPKTAAQTNMETLMGKPPLDFFGYPFDVAANRKGLVFVSDTQLRTVRVFDMVNNKLERLNDETVFGTPLGMAVDSHDNLYVCDGHFKTVMVFDARRQPLYSIGGKEVFENPSYIALDEKRDRIYVSDGKAAKIKVFDMQGKFLREFGAYGGAPGNFRVPQGLAVDGEGRLFVADQLNARVQVFSGESEFLYTFGERTDQVFGFEGPKDLAFDSEGNLHILDVRKSLLLSYAPDGKLLLATGGRSATTNPVGFSAPTGIFIDRNDRFYIADSFNKRFSMWQYLSDAYLEKNPIK